ncbi:MAG TPA: BrnT family toxin [Thermoanaerobaculia bacterium]|nr:BrnT family toxin [Thermoanaerobaculia bacterium]
MISERFEWDDAKAEWSEAKHGITFPIAEQVFDDPLHATMPDARHAEIEDRYITIGETFWREVLVVAHAERGDRIRIISARRATRSEKRRYMKKEFDTINDAIDDEDDLLPEYDFTGAVRGKYYRPGKSTIRMTVDEDVARYFYSSELLNEGLRKLIAEGRAPEPRNE